MPTPARFASSAALLWVASLLLPASATALQADQVVADSTAALDSLQAPDSLADDSAPVVMVGPSDRAEVETWLDGYMDAYLKQAHVAGATVSLVRGGQIWLSKGYGYADVAERTPVDPERTLFRIGSVSKLFVWTSVMQLVQQGRLALDADVNEYLEGLEIPDTYPAPVTLADIMSHSAGFEDHVIGLFGRSEADLRPLVELLNEQMPDRVRPPGELASYSNHATAIAMLVVEQVSGVPWERYIEENILNPLGMAQTTFSQPVPAALASDLSRGYTWSDGRYTEQPFEYVPLAPVGAASASAEDMARFMAAHLALGEGMNGARILEEGTALDMQSPLLRHASGVNAMLHGFAEYSKNGVFAYGHGGDTEWFHTILLLVPESELGLFVSTNSASGRPADVAQAFVDRYYPLEAWTPSEPAPDFSTQVAGLLGEYRSSRYSHDDVTKLAVLTEPTLVTDGGDGALRLSTRGDTRWVQVAPLLFRDETGDDQIAFAVDDEGRGTHLYAGAPYVGLERVPRLESPGLHTTLVLGALLLFGLSVAVLPLAAFFRFRFGAAPVAHGDHISGLGRFLVWAAAAVFLVFVATLVPVVSSPSTLATGQTGFLRGLLWLPLVGTGFTALALVHALWLWGTGQGTRLGRVAYTLVVLAAALFVWQLWTFNLIGWNL